MSNTPTTLVLVDPTSPDGETSLGALGATDTHVALVLQLSGRHSAALREFAVAEQVDMATAGWIYLDQVHERTARDGRTVETVLTTGPSVDCDVELLVQERPVRRVVIPSSMASADRHLADRIRQRAQVDVTVAELVPAS